MVSLYRSLLRPLLFHADAETAHALGATALDALGNELLFEVSRRAQDRLHADAVRRGLSLAGELRAGDPGLALDAQPAVLQLVWPCAPAQNAWQRASPQPLLSAQLLLPFLRPVALQPWQQALLQTASGQPYSALLCVQSAR